MAEQVDEDDPALGVLFIKQLGEERFLVRFPAEPMYQYSERGELVVEAEKEGEVFQLFIRQAGPESGDLHYELEGKWIHEHFARSKDHFFHFKTFSNSAKSTRHDEFISSFFIEEIQK